MVLETLEKDPRYHPELSVVVEKATSKEVTHFVVFLSSQLKNTEFYVDHSNLNKECTIVDFDEKYKGLLPPEEGPEEV